MNTKKERQKEFMARSLVGMVMYNKREFTDEECEVYNSILRLFESNVPSEPKPAPSPAPTIKKDLTVGPPKKMSPEATEKILRQIESRDDYSNICPTPTIITPVDEYFFARVGDRAALYEKLPDNKPGKLVCEIPPCPAPLPKEVEEMIHTLDLLADDWYSTSGEYGESPDFKANETMKPHVEAIRAVIKAALQPKVVSREWVAWFVKTIFDMRDKGVSFPIEGAAETMLQSQGIEVGEKP